MKKTTYKILILIAIFLSDSLFLQAQKDKEVKVYGDDIRISVNPLIDPFNGGCQIQSNIKISSDSLLTQTQQYEWVRVYGDNISNDIRGLIETYDGGYLIGAHIKQPGSQLIKDGLLIKTDINGEILWQKIIGGGADDKINGSIIRQTADGGYIFLSATQNFQPTINVFIMKLNKCGEKEWSKVFIDDNMHQMPYGIQIMNDGTYLIQLAYWHSDLGNDRIWLFNIDQQGEIIWQKAQANWTLGTNSEEGYHLLKNSNNEYLISGQYYQGKPGEDTSIRYRRPMFIKVDSLGNEIWHQLWGVNDFFVGSVNKSEFDSKGNFFGVGRNSSDNDMATGPVLFRLGKDGEQLYHKDLIEDSDGGITTTISIMDDTTLFIGANYFDTEHIGHNRILKTDTLGNIINQRELLNELNTFTHSLITYDNKLLIAGNFYVDGNLDIYLWKLNKDLEYDSIYTQPRVYDSLCPYPIVSDTLDIDTTIVNLQELYAQLYKIKVHPNPASSKLIITLGDLTNGTDLILYNTSGIKVKTIKLMPGQKEYMIDISNMSAGMYVAMLWYNGRIVDKKKVVIN